MEVTFIGCIKCVFFCITKYVIIRSISITYLVRPNRNLTRLIEEHRNNVVKKSQGVISFLLCTFSLIWVVLFNKVDVFRRMSDMVIKEER